MLAKSLTRLDACARIHPSYFRYGDSSGMPGSSGKPKRFLGHLRTSKGDDDVAISGLFGGWHVTCHPSQTNAAASVLLTEAYDRVRRFRGSAIAELNLSDLYLQSPYAVVELTDGSQGVALNLGHQDQPFAIDERLATPQGGPRDPRDWRTLAAGLLELSKQDPLLTETLFARPSPNPPHEAAVRVAILNALSQAPNGRAYFPGRGLIAEDLPPPLNALTQKGDVVGVVGFRLHDFRQALYNPNVRRVLVSDPFWSQSSEMRSQGKEFSRYFEGQLELRDGSQSEAVVAEADVAILAGSALCDGTMDGLLQAARNGRCRRIIVRGHSAGILSEVLFDHGATMHLPSRIPRNFLQEARTFMERFRRRGRLRVLSEVRTVLEEDNFYDFIDLRLAPMVVRERLFSLDAVKRRLKRKANGLAWGRWSLRHAEAVTH